MTNLILILLYLASAGQKFEGCSAEVWATPLCEKQAAPASYRGPKEEVSRVTYPNMASQGACVDDRLAGSPAAIWRNSIVDLYPMHEITFSGVTHGADCEVIFYKSALCRAPKNADRIKVGSMTFATKFGAKPAKSEVVSKEHRDFCEWYKGHQVAADMDHMRKEKPLFVYEAVVTPIFVDMVTGPMPLGWDETETGDSAADDAN